MGLLAILVLILCVSTIVIIVLYSLRWLEVSHSMFMIVKYTYTFVCLIVNLYMQLRLQWRLCPGYHGIVLEI